MQCSARLGNMLGAASPTQPSPPGPSSLEPWSVISLQPCETDRIIGTEDETDRQARMAGKAGGAASLVDRRSLDSMGNETSP